MEIDHGASFAGALGTLVAAVGASFAGALGAVVDGVVRMPMRGRVDSPFHGMYARDIGRKSRMTSSGAGAVVGAGVRLGGGRRAETPALVGDARDGKFFGRVAGAVDGAGGATVGAGVGDGAGVGGAVVGDARKGTFVGDARDGNVVGDARVGYTRSGSTVGDGAGSVVGDGAGAGAIVGAGVGSVVDDGVDDADEVVARSHADRDRINARVVQ